jgi:hypothetical protein
MIVQPHGKRAVLEVVTPPGLESDLLAGLVDDRP